MPSVPSIDRQKASTVFRSVEHSHVRDVLPVVEDRLSEVLSGEETRPDLPVLATLLGRVQVGGTQRLIAADKAHEEELLGDIESRQRRDEQRRDEQREAERQADENDEDIGTRNRTLVRFGAQTRAYYLDLRCKHLPYRQALRFWKLIAQKHRTLTRRHGARTVNRVSRRAKASAKARCGPTTRRLVRRGLAAIRRDVQ